MINYVIQVILFQALFLAVYDFFLSKETFFSKNRWYLLGTSIVSFLLPLIKIPTFQEAIPQEFSIALPEIILSPQSVIEQSRMYQSIDYIDIIFGFGLCVFLLVFLVKLFKLTYLILSSKIEKREHHRLIILPKSKKAFSFFNYIFLGNEIAENEKDKIVAHEMVHSRQKHTYDLMFFELLKIVMWFNPLLYVYQKRIATVHEYISDAEVVKSTPKETYINKLINELFDVENITFVNQFHKHSLLKKRIIMMTKEKSKQIRQAKYLLLIPVLVSMVFYTSCSLSKNDEVLEPVNQLLNKKSNTKVSRTPEEITEESIPFAIIEKIPTFPDCEENDRKCFSKSIQKHFAENFNVDLPNQLGLESGKKRLIVQFKVDKEGNIVGIFTRAPHKKIEEEAVRVISMLPKMNPGEQDGKRTSVKYTLPIRFDVK